MKTYMIFDENCGRDCCLVEARDEKSALRKYRKGLLSTGIYSIVTEANRPHLISSFGCDYVANVTIKSKSEWR